jgi:hypothetical protein
MNRQSASVRAFRLFMVLLCLAGTAGVGWTDYVTGYEISVLPLYAVPVGFMTWAVGSVPGVLLALASGLVWWWADRASGHPYSAAWIGYSNAAVRTVMYLFVVVAIAYIRDTVGLVRRRARALTGPVPVCTRCRRLCDPAGSWSDFETFLRLHTSAQPVAKVCPDCARRIYSEEKA